MKKIDEMYKYLNENGGKDKDYLVKHLVKEFGISKKSTETYYYRWKKEFMKTSKCVLKDLVKKINNKEVDEVKEKVREVEKINIDCEPKEKVTEEECRFKQVPNKYY